MDAKQQEFFVRLYDRFKDLIPFMTMYKPPADQKNAAVPASTAVDLNDVMDLPHMGEFKQELQSKILKRITFLPSVAPQNPSQPNKIKKKTTKD